MDSIPSTAPEPWRREWPLALAVLTLTLALLGKGWIATALDQPVPLIALLTVLCGVILAAVVLNGFMGLALLLGGVRHSEQLYNLQSANAFLVMILPSPCSALFSRISPVPLQDPRSQRFRWCSSP